jgi:hypothetical protein
VLFAPLNSPAVESTIDSTLAEQLKQLNNQTITGNRASLGSDWANSNTLRPFTTSEAIT